MFAAGSEPIPSTVEKGAPGSYELGTSVGLGNSYPLLLLTSEELVKKRPRSSRGAGQGHSQGR